MKSFIKLPVSDSLNALLGKGKEHSKMILLNPNQIVAIIDCGGYTRIETTIADYTTGAPDRQGIYYAIMPIAALEAEIKKLDEE